ncbi:MAG TPA: ATP-binding cassette domain-containing protein [Candidatus Limnocylindrales bacterium]|jgi:osmoprotectant transport system ATP-binding protein|nr:ATP-binding cassette domain-containing protein [Candidatus Limnocylindrales bacterium]
MPTSVYGALVQTAATVEFRNVTKRYDGRSKVRAEGETPGAVNDLSLIVPAGKVCVLVGPSGCGKTTSLKMVNRLIEPTSGQILIDGQDVAAEDPVALRRRIGYVIQQVGLFPHQTIADNVATVPRLLGWPGQRIAARTDELLALVGLEPDAYRGRYPAQLSGGERQRVGVARALAADPPLLLMDEPFGAVDPIVRERLQDELLRLQEQLAKTILFVTHDVDEAIKMGDLMAVMAAGGALAQVGTPAEVLAQPASEFVTRFVGADRGLKRLSLRRVRDLELLPATAARPGDDAAEAGQRAASDEVGYLLLVDAQDRPIGWLRARDIPLDGPLSADAAVPMSPLLAEHATLKDALSMMLAADVMAGIVVDPAGRALGLLTVEQIARTLRDG